MDSLADALGMSFGKRKLKMTKKAIAARRAYRLKKSPGRRRKSPGRRRKSPGRRRKSARGCPGSRTCSETKKYIDFLEGRVTSHTEKGYGTEKKIKELETLVRELKGSSTSDKKKEAAVKKLQKSIRDRNAKRSKLAADSEEDFDSYSAVWGFGKRLKMTKKAIAARRAYRLRNSPVRRRRKSPIRRRKSPIRRRKSPIRRRKSPIRRRKSSTSDRTYGNIPLSMQMDDSDLSVFGKRLKMTRSAIAARRAYRRRNSPRRRKSPVRRRSRGRSRSRSPRRGRKMSKRVIYANAKKAMRLHHRTGISLKAAWRKVLGKKRSRFGYENMSDLSEFGMATVCGQGYSPNRRWRKGKGTGQKRCTKDKIKKITLNELQAIAVQNGVNIYKPRKGGGYTRTPVSGKALKSRLSRAKVSYKYGRNKSITYV